MNKAPTQRMLRVGELVRHALSDLLIRGQIIDPIIETNIITISEVRMSPDLKLASAYVIPLGGKNAEDVVRALNSHKKFIRGKIVPQLKLKYAPDISFFIDDRFDEAEKIEQLLHPKTIGKDIEKPKNERS